MTNGGGSEGAGGNRGIGAVLREALTLPSPTDVPSANHKVGLGTRLRLCPKAKDALCTPAGLQSSRSINRECKTEVGE
ncbi:Hypothetical predicted protein, partial [Marmota monax]